MTFQQMGFKHFHIGRIPLLVRVRIARKKSIAASRQWVDIVDPELDLSLKKREAPGETIEWWKCAQQTRELQVLIQTNKHALGNLEKIHTTLQFDGRHTLLSSTAVDTSQLRRYI